MFHRFLRGPFELAPDRIDLGSQRSGHLIPALRAYSGFRIPDARRAPLESLGRIGSLEARRFPGTRALARARPLPLEADLGAPMERHLRIRARVGRGCNDRVREFRGNEPDRLALPLSFLYHFARAPVEWDARAMSHRHVRMDRIRKEEIDPRAAMRELPPLLKGYLRLGAFVGNGAVIDTQFNTTDVLIILPVKNIDRRYAGYFGPNADQKCLQMTNAT